MVSVQDSNSVFGDIGATHADLMEAVQSFVCVVIHLHYTRVKGENELG